MSDQLLVEPGAAVRSASGSRARPLRGTLADYLSLTKPGVMSLLLLTELLAMVVAARGWPGWGLSLAALAGGAL
ncbi:MAG: heme o synthase, partial [Candidatus Dormibacteria bacterium]